MIPARNIEIQFNLSLRGYLRPDKVILYLVPIRYTNPRATLPGFDHLESKIGQGARNRPIANYKDTTYTRLFLHHTTLHDSHLNA